METLVLTIMLLVALGFIAKLSFHNTLGICIIAAVAALFTGLSQELAITRSTTGINSWLSQPDLMLDTSVILTLDVAMQFAFCILMARQCSGSLLTRTERICLATLKWIPGLLIFPVLFMLLVSVIFTMTGHDFSTLAWETAAAIFAVTPLLTIALKAMLPDEESRMELVFLVNALIAVTGIIATVNGRTAVAGTGSVEAAPLTGVILLLIAGAITGLLHYRHRNSNRRMIR